MWQNWVPHPSKQGKLLHPLSLKEERAENATKAAAAAEQDRALPPVDRAAAVAAAEQLLSWSEQDRALLSASAGGRDLLETLTRKAAGDLLEEGASPGSAPSETPQVRFFTYFHCVFHCV